MSKQIARRQRARQKDVGNHGHPCKATHGVRITEPPTVSIDLPAATADLRVTVLVLISSMREVVVAHGRCDAAGVP